MAHHFCFLDPGHFHAALVLREASPRIDNRIVVYSDAGRELDAFVNLINAFNQREQNPTHWHIEVRPSDLSRVIADSAANIVVLAGRNNDKLMQIAALAQAGKSVFADKPWLTDSTQTQLLDSALNGAGFVMDIMTIRHEILSRLCHEVVHSEDVFGGFAESSVDQPAIELGSVHHLFKQVNGAPLRRPPWYFDARQQGDGMVDIQSHLIEQAMWFVADDDPVRTADMQLLAARRWATPVSAELYAQITGDAAFPAALAQQVDASGDLQYPCNGQIVWSLNGVVIEQNAVWRNREPVGGSDLHKVVLRGKRATVSVEQGPETDFSARVLLRPARHTGMDTLQAAAENALPRWRERFAGLNLDDRGDAIEMVAPAGLDDGHESHFPLVRDRFLDILDGPGEDASLTARIRARYQLIANARDLALSGASL